MDKETLRKVQLVQLEIAKEIKRVCEKNKLKYRQMCQHNAEKKQGREFLNLVSYRSFTSENTSIQYKSSII